MLNLLAVFKPECHRLLQRSPELILRHGGVALESVTQGHQWRVGANRLVVSPFQWKSVFVQQVQEVEQIRTAHLDGRCRQ